MDGQVFMCYAREDEDFVLKLAGALKKRGVPVWLDQWDIPASADWDMEVEQALSTSSHLIVVLSPASMKSREVRGEWRVALEDGKQVVPVLFQNCRIHRLLRLLQHIDFTSRSPTDATAVGEIVSALKGEKRSGAEEARQAAPGASPSGASPQVSLLSSYLSSQAKDAEGAPLFRPSGQRRTSTSFSPWLRTLPRTSTPEVATPSLMKGDTADAEAGKKGVAAPEPEFYERPAWWACLPLGLGAGIGGEFLADWLLRWVAGMFDYEFPTVEGKWLALLLGGLVWGLVYALVGALENADTEFLVLMPILPYGSVFDFYEFGDILRGLLGAWPICFLASWGAANGLAVAAEMFLSWPYATVAFIAFGILTSVCLGMFWVSADDNIF